MESVTMSLLDQLAGQVLGSLGGGQQQGGQNMQAMLLQAVMAAVQNNEGGLGGLLAKFTGAGMGDQVASWVGNGENQPIDADQVGSALGGQLGDLAAQLGVPQEQIAGHLAEMLPQIVNHLTPNGQVPAAGGDALSQGLSALGGLFGR
jgi:uncharacterized protein YidB (DUF937 family)